MGARSSRGHSAGDIGESPMPPLRWVGRFRPGFCLHGHGRSEPDAWPKDTRPDREHRHRSGALPAGMWCAVLENALAVSWSCQSHGFTLLTGRKDEATLRFYEKAGFDRHAGGAEVQRISDSRGQLCFDALAGVVLSPTISISVRTRRTPPRPGRQAFETLTKGFSGRQNHSPWRRSGEGRRSTDSWHRLRKRGLRARSTLPGRARHRREPRPVDRASPRRWSCPP